MPGYLFERLENESRNLELQVGVGVFLRCLGSWEKRSTGLEREGFAVNVWPHGCKNTTNALRQAKAGSIT
jgi:hypothetical protein